ncbi:hypothetical protein G7Y89_g6904 [Cudoniella acicularis]|uniref:DUF7907 domain-containing protein n=1 Tax=Cudoniella acicularis TaxID=354080 RepID=A0A8H4W524_9HELO|nr:hypothetical protein G7Y89_g6904 [Cudoniella acicularis]
MGFLRTFVTAAAALSFTALATASPTPTQLQARQNYVPGTQNNTQEFYINMNVISGPQTYDGYSCTFPSPFPLSPTNIQIVVTWHTGAGFADPVFVNTTGSRSFLNGTNLQFDVSPYPFSALGFPSDTNYARWEPISIASGFGSGAWVFDQSGNLVIDNEEFDGWLVCEWYHGINAPQLFQLVKGFDGGKNKPSPRTRVTKSPPANFVSEKLPNHFINLANLTQSSSQTPSPLNSNHTNMSTTTTPTLPTSPTSAADRPKLSANCRNTATQKYTACADAPPYPGGVQLQRRITVPPPANKPTEQRTNPSATSSQNANPSSAPATFFRKNFTPFKAPPTASPSTTFKNAMENYTSTREKGGEWSIRPLTPIPSKKGPPPRSPRGNKTHRSSPRNNNHETQLHHAFHQQHIPRLLATRSHLPLPSPSNPNSTIKESYVLDLAAAQFGYCSPLVPYSTYFDTCILHHVPSSPKGEIFSASGTVKSYILHEARQASIAAQIRTANGNGIYGTVAGALERGVLEWEDKKGEDGGMKVRKLARKSEGVFEGKVKELMEFWKGNLEKVEELRRERIPAISYP